MQAEPDTAVSLLDLERWATGDLPPDEARALEARRADDPDLDARMSRVRRDLDAAAVDLPPLELPREPVAQGSQTQSWWSMLGGLFLVGAVAASAMLFVPADVPDTSPKWRGAALDLEVFRLRGADAQRQGALIKAREGDRLQYSITSKHDGYISVFDIQDDGEISQWLAPTETQAGGTVEGAVRLDDYAGAERVFFMASDEPIGIDVVKAALERGSMRPLSDLDALPGIDAAQRSVLVLEDE
jgi:hypothetical protein